MSVRVELRVEDIVRFDVMRALVEFDVIGVETSPNVDGGVIGGDMVAVEFTNCVDKLLIVFTLCLMLDNEVTIFCS